MFSGVSVNHLGHCHPNITRAINQQCDTLGNVTTIYVTEAMVDLDERLIDISPKSLIKVFSVPEAQRPTNSLHGNTHTTFNFDRDKLLERIIDTGRWSCSCSSALLVPMPLQKDTEQLPSWVCPRDGRQD